MAARPGCRFPGCRENQFGRWRFQPPTPRCWWPEPWTACTARMDGGDTWQRISPASDAQIKNIESIAVDPKDPNVIYAGTWHLAWKTADGGATWQHINKGMIEDSDVFSIIVDSSDPSVVFASACSGIYRSADAGAAVQQDSGHSFLGAAHAGFEAGSQQPGHRLCGNDRRPVEDHGFRQDLEAGKQLGNRGQRCSGGSAQLAAGSAGHRSRGSPGQRGRRA